MALRAVLQHPKFADFKVRINASKAVALGYLECIWHFTGHNAPQGNIGKFTDSQIESWVEWDGEPGALIQALTESGWLDVDSVHRLMVHDWHEHADDATKKSLKRKNLTFYLPVSRQCPDSVPTVSPGTERNGTEENGIYTPTPQVLETEEPKPPLPSVCVEGLWWEEEDSVAAQVAKCVLGTICGPPSKLFSPYKEPQISEKHARLCAEFLERCEPDDEALELFWDNWQDYHSGKRKAPYSNPCLALVTNWLPKREADWLKRKSGRTYSGVDEVNRILKLVEGGS